MVEPYGSLMEYQMVERLIYTNKDDDDDDNNSRFNNTYLTATYSRLYVPQSWKDVTIFRTPFQSPIDTRYW